LKNFSKDFNQNREALATFCSPKQKIGEYNWALGAKVGKYSNHKNEYFLVPFLQFAECESVDQSKFPVDAYVKFCILNQEKDSRKTFSKCMLCCY
jgi:hypothetical protein